MTFSAEQINKLRNRVKSVLSEKRYLHSVGVEKCAVKLASFCLPEAKSELAVAALLHDVTKEYSQGEHLSILAINDVALSEAELESGQIFHSYTAPYVIKSEYSEYATPNVLSAVKHHTVGDENMSVFDEIVFLADYIEETRTLQTSIALGEYVFSQMQEGNTESNVAILHDAALKSINFTISHLIEKNRYIIEKTILTRNALISKILHI